MEEEKREDFIFISLFSILTTELLIVVFCASSFDRTDRFGNRKLVLSLERETKNNL